MDWEDVEKEDKRKKWVKWWKKRRDRIKEDNTDEQGNKFRREK